MNVPFGTAVAEAGFVCQLRAFTVTSVDLGVEPDVKLTVTLPPVTIAPDQEVVLTGPDTLAPPLENCQPATRLGTTPETWQLIDEARVTGLGEQVTAGVRT